MSQKKKICVIGAGPAGITACYQLSKQSDYELDLYEASNSVGGMSKTIELWNQKVDIGPHRFFSSDNRINELWLEVVKNDYEMVDRLTRIYYRKKFFSYPIKAFNALQNLGIFTAFRCILDYFLEKFKKNRDLSTFEGWVINRFGNRLYTIFFKTYTEKLWGIPCSELDADFASQRIKKFSLGEAIKAALFGNSGKHKTLVEQFAYPNEGTGMVYERMSASILANSGQVFLNKPIQKIIIENNKAVGIITVDGETKYYDHIISSMPVTQLVSRIENVPTAVLEATNKLKFRNTIIVYLNINAIDLFPDNWIYIHSDTLQMGRMTNFRNWVPSIINNEKTTICALEFWCYNDDKLWNISDAELIELAKSEFKQTGIGPENIEILGGHVYKIPKCYPVYAKGYKEPLSEVQKYLKTIDNLQVIGRYGAFKYNNQDHSILMGILAADNIVENKNHDLWEVNTDYDNYQEASVITKTGLQKLS